MRRIFCYLRRISHPALIVGPTYEATLALASFARRAARGRSGGGITGAQNSATVFVGEYATRIPCEIVSRKSLRTALLKVAMDTTHQRDAHNRPVLEMDGRPLRGRNHRREAGQRPGSALHRYRTMEVCRMLKCSESVGARSQCSKLLMSGQQRCYARMMMAQARPRSLARLLLRARRALRFAGGGALRCFFK